MGTFIIKKTPSGAFNFSLIASNKEKIAVSSQVYTTKSACKKGIESALHRREPDRGSDPEKSAGSRSLPEV